MSLPLFVRKLICALQGAKWLSDVDVVFQEGFEDCGEACAKMVLSYFEQSGELPKEAVRFRPDGCGLILLEIANALKYFELEVVGFQFSSLDEIKRLLLEQSKIVFLVVLRESRIPCVQKVLDHLVMLVLLTDEHAELKDPTLGHICVTRGVLSKKWIGKGLLVYSKPR